MNEEFMQAIVEKLEAIEIAQLKNLDSSKNDIRSDKILAEIKMLQAHLGELSRQIDASNTNLKNSLEKSLLFDPKQQSIHQSYMSHTHHFHKGVWIIAGLSMVLLFLFYGWINCSIASKQYKNNDIKYRYLKVYSNSELLNKVFYVDSMFYRNRDAFTDAVIQREKVIARLGDSLRIAFEMKK